MSVRTNIRLCLRLRYFHLLNAYNKKNQGAGSDGSMLGESKAAAVTALGLPRDVLLGDVLVSFIGRREVWIENYRSILLYTDTLVKVQARTCKVVIHGARLKIEYYTIEEMKITGQIQSLEFES